MPTIQIPISTIFKFVPTVFSHGWYELPPFSYDEKHSILTRIQKLKDGNIVKLLIRPYESFQKLEITIEGLNNPLNQKQQEEITTLVKRALNLEQDLTEFYQLCQEKPRYQWIQKIGAGRLLVSATVWEDLVKVLLTTNTTWKFTITMCDRLVQIGDKYPGGGYCFPTPQQIANLTIPELAQQVRSGYRTPYLHELATAIAEEHLDVETWYNSQVTSQELYRQIKALKGFGDYAASSMLKLLGRFEYLAIDTIGREVFKVQLNQGHPASDQEIRTYYNSFGKWCGIVMWMDVMKKSFTSYGVM